MSGSVDARIPLSFRPTPNVGPDYGAMIQNAQQTMQMQEQQRQVEQQNALRNILGAPGAIGPMGVPTPDAISKVYGVDPGVGMKIQQQTNALGVQQANMQEHALKRHATIQDMVDPIRTAAIRIYNDTPGSEEAKQRAARDYMLPELAKLKSGGTLTPQEADRLPTDFNIRTATANSDAWQKQQREERRDAITERRADIADRREVDAARDRGMTTNQDTDGKVFFIRPNAPPGQRMLYEDGTPVPTEKQTGAHKVGTGGAAGTVAATEASIQADLRKEHPDWSAGQIALEAKKRVAGAITTVRVTAKQAAEMGVPETPEEAAAKAGQVASGQPLNQVIPGLGQSAVKAREKARQDAIQLILDTTPGMTPTQAGLELANRGIEYATGKKASGILGSTLATSRQAVKQLDFNVDKVTEEMGKLASSDISPVINAIVRGVEKWTGDPEYSSLFFFMQAAAMESARILSGGTASIQQLHEGARKEAEKWANINMTPSSWKAVSDAMKEEGHFRIKSYEDALKEARVGAGREPRPSTGGTAPPPGQSGAPTPSGGPSGGVTPPQQAIDMLKADPSLAPQFDTTFGPGAARKVLGGGKAQPAPPAPAQTAPAAPAQTAPAARPAAPAPQAAAPAAIPQRPSNVPQGSMYSPSRKMWRTPDGKVLDADGKPVATP